MKKTFKGRQRPYLGKHERMSARVVREVIEELRRMNGEEMWLRHYDEPTCAGPTASRMRGYLGPDYYVRRCRGDVYVRARRVGEPPIKLRKVRLGKEWMTMPQAAEYLGITQQWLRTEYVNKGRLTKYKFGTRVVVRVEDVKRIAKRRKPGGSWLRKDRA